MNRLFDQRQTVFKLISVAILSVLLVNPIISFSDIFLFDETPYPDTFKQNIIDVYENDSKVDDNIYHVSIYCEGWYIDLPYKYIEATVNNHR